MLVNFKILFDKRGEEIVEASIVLPIIILVIILLIRLCTFYLECLISQTNLHSQMLDKWDASRSPIVKSFDERKNVNYMNKGLAEDMLNKTIEAKAYSICEDNLVRAGGNFGKALEE